MILALASCQAQWLPLLPGKLFSISRPAHLSRAVILKQYASKYPEQPLVNLFQTLPLYELELKTDDACKLADILELEEMLTPEKIVIYRLLKFNVQQDGQSGSIDSCQAFKRLCERLGTLFPKVGAIRHIAF